MLEFDQVFYLNTLKGGVLMMEECFFLQNQANDSLIKINQQASITIKITRSSFIKNYNFNFGAAIMVKSLYLQSYIIISIEDCAFNQNQANKYGSFGLLNFLGNINIRRTNFSQNSILNSGSIIYLEGLLQNSFLFVQDSLFVGNNANINGGVFCLQSIVGNISIYNSNFTKNVALGKGGVIHLLSFMQNSAFLIQDSLFVENFAQDVGGALSFQYIGGNISLIRNKFTQNFGISFGGAICLAVLNQNFVFIIEKCVFLKNNATDQGGVLYLGSISGNIWIVFSNFSSNLDLNKGGVMTVYNLLPNSSILIQDSLFVENKANDAGGVFFLQSIIGHVSILRCNFTKNLHLSFGGVACLLSLLPNSVFLIQESLFSGNRANSAGGVLYLGSIGSNLSVIKSNFTKNVGLSLGGVICLMGLTKNSIFIVQENVFIENNASAEGGVLYLESISGDIRIFLNDLISNFDSNQGGAINVKSLLPNASLLVQNCLFIGNEANNQGGAIQILFLYGNLNIIQSFFKNNKVSSFGGAISLNSLFENSNLLINDCLFGENNSSKGGGAIYFEYLVGIMNIVRCNFFKNFDLIQGGAIYVSLSLQKSKLIFSNCLFSENIANVQGGSLSFQYLYGNLTFFQNIFNSSYATVMGGAILCYIFCTIFLKKINL